MLLWLLPNSDAEVTLKIFHHFLKSNIGAPISQNGSPMLSQLCCNSWSSLQSTQSFAGVYRHGKRTRRDRDWWVVLLFSHVNQHWCCCRFSLWLMVDQSGVEYLWITGCSETTFYYYIGFPALDANNEVCCLVGVFEDLRRSGWEDLVELLIEFWGWEPSYLCFSLPSSHQILNISSFTDPKTLMKLNWLSFWAYFPPKTLVTTETNILIPKTES